MSYLQALSIVFNRGCAGTTSSTSTVLCKLFCIYNHWMHVRTFICPYRCSTVFAYHTFSSQPYGHQTSHGQSCFICFIPRRQQSSGLDGGCIELLHLFFRRRTPPPPLSRQQCWFTNNLSCLPWDSCRLSFRWWPCQESPWNLHTRFLNRISTTQCLTTSLVSCS